MIHRRAPWKTKESLELATLEWVSWFNHHRLLEPIGYIPPAEAEANYYRHVAEQVAMPAWLKPTGLHETRADSPCVIRQGTGQGPGRAKRRHPLPK